MGVGGGLEGPPDTLFPVLDPAGVEPEVLALPAEGKGTGCSPEATEPEVTLCAASAPMSSTPMSSS